MSSFIDRLSGSLTPEQIERIGNTAHEFVKAAEADPKFLEEYLEKVGISWGDVAKLTGVGMATTAGTALGGLGIAAGMDWLDDRKKAKRYQEMINANPELRGRGVDAKMVQRHFATLHRFNPSYADDPMVAGAYVQNQLEAARPNIEALNNIVKARSERAEGTRGRSQAASQVMRDIIGPTQRAVESSIAQPPAAPPTPMERLKGLSELHSIEKGFGKPEQKAYQPLMQEAQKGLMTK
jgi:hypothetical protein